MRVGPQNGRFRATMSLFSMFPTRARDRMYAYRKCEAMSSGYIIVPKPTRCLFKGNRAARREVRLRICVVVYVCDVLVGSRRMLRAIHI
jgi:hypothetical protein